VSPGPTAGSLRWRLLAGTLAWTLVTLGVAGWGLRALLREHIEQQLQVQLAAQLDVLSAAVDWEPGKGIAVMPPASDARFARPLSGLYWQIDRLGDQPQKALARSRSLWDQTLTLPARRAARSASDDRPLSLRGAQGQTLLALARTLQLPEDDAPPLRLVVAGDEALVAEPLARFTRLLLLAMATLAAGLVLAVVVQLQLALAPLERLRQRLAAVRDGQAERIAGRFPRELEPLVQEFNRVLAANAELVQRARTQAGNLAHAVHTPLTILGNAAARENSTLAALVREQVRIAERQVDHHLARARAAAAVRATGLNTPVLAPLHAILRTMRRLHAGRTVAFELAPGAVDARFRGEEQDLYEMLGNLVDNAGKWARARVVVDVQRAGERLCLDVDDDGPGIPADERARMFERGVQLDERRPGSGLGLDIVRTLAETYGGRIEALPSPLGGARLRLYLPAAD